MAISDSQADILESMMLPAIETEKVSPIPQNLSDACSDLAKVVVSLRTEIIDEQKRRQRADDKVSQQLGSLLEFIHGLQAKVNISEAYSLYEASDGAPIELQEQEIKNVTSTASSRPRTNLRRFARVSTVEDEERGGQVFNEETDTLQPEQDPVGLSHKEQSPAESAPLFEMEDLQHDSGINLRSVSKDHATKSMPSFDRDWQWNIGLSSNRSSPLPSLTSTESSLDRDSTEPSDEEPIASGSRTSKTSKSREFTPEQRPKVKASNSKGKIPTHNNLPWTPEEEKFAGETIVKLLAPRNISGAKVFEKVSELLRTEKGSIRTPGTITLRWYTKLRYIYSPAKVVEEVLQEDGHAAAKELKPSQLTGGDLLMRARLGDAFNTRRSRQSAKSALRQQGGQHFVTSRTWTGASNDIIDVAFSPDSNSYVVGSAAMEPPYSRPNNLLFGDIAHNQLRALPGHSKATSSPTPQLSDSSIYYTVSAVEWCADMLYTAGFDGTVKLWEASNPEKCAFTLPHRSGIQVMATSNPDLNLLATGTDSGPESLRLYPNVTNGGNGSRILLPPGKNQSTFSYAPNCMKFGRAHHYSNHLLVGFGMKADSDTSPPPPHGFLGLWRIDEGRASRIPLKHCDRQVFDVAWSTQSNMFISGNTTGHKCSAIPGSIVRIYDGGRTDDVLEARCPAIDMNEISICPYDERILSASCTNGKTYVWDIRRLNTPCHVLKHGANVSGHLSEISDTGVRVVQWGNERSEFFTGSSDGALRKWDIRKNERNALTEDVINTGVELMCGKISPDGSTFFVGDASGSIRLLTRSPTRELEDDSEPIDFIYADGSHANIEAQHEEITTGSEGKEAAEELIKTGQIVIDKFYGPGQGPKYSGPFASWARPPQHGNKKRLRDVPLLPEVEAMQRWSRTSRTEGRGVKRKRMEEGEEEEEKKKKKEKETPRPSKKILLKYRQPRTRSFSDLHDVYRISPDLGFGMSREMQADHINGGDEDTDSDPDFDSDWSSDNANQPSDSSSEGDEDDGYIPPHWMVDANLAKSVPD